MPRTHTGRTQMSAEVQRVVQHPPSGLVHISRRYETPLGSTKRPLWEVEVELSLQQSLCKSRWPEAGANFVPGLQHVKLCRVVLAGERENNTNNTITAISRRKEGTSLHLGLFACLLANTRKKEAKIPSQHSTLHHPSSQVSTYKQPSSQVYT